eukprot:TRINITY_DN64307_c0_g1_i1.p1 TRINITY_DN64307_c0_g1~~TRINITY_DN64307_c0_g1_i1.p1  ORF type:complete len:260 (-),score=76.74 TRINITY_DN64307_c0_g1_i1:53-727(-)
MHEDWKRLLQSENTARSERFQKIHSELSGELRQLDMDLQDISATIEMVEGNRAAFQFDDAEIASRKRFVSDTRKTVKDIQDNVTSQRTFSKMESDKRQLLSSSASMQKDRDERQGRMLKDNQDFLDRQRQSQMQIVAQQDEDLSALSASAQRLGNTAQIINTELKEQQKMLEELDEDIDKETEKLNFVMKRMGRLLKTSDNKQLCLIIGLSLLMVFLIFLVINT